MACGVGIALIAAAWMLALANLKLAQRQLIALIGATLIAVLAMRGQSQRGPKKKRRAHGQ